MPSVRRTAALVLAPLVLLAGGTVTSATPPSGTSSDVPVFGDLPEGKSRADRIDLRVRKDSRVASFTLTYAVSGQSGWHEHPGIVLAVVEQGSVTRQAGCATETFTAGDAFTEVGPHLVRNVGAEAAVLRIMQVYPADAPARRVEVDPPVCP